METEHLSGLYDITGVRGCIDLGIRATATVSSALLLRRRHRSHWQDILNIIEAAMEEQKTKLSNEEDCAVWKSSPDAYKHVFSTKNTWSLFHQQAQTVDWHKSLWFKHHTPKFACFTWLVIQNCLTIGDRMLQWSSSINPAYVFCNQLETRDHLFFSCPFAAEVWSRLTKNLLRGRLTTDWIEIIEITKDNSQDFLSKFLTRYVFQLSIHSLWRKRNDRRHGATPTTVSVMVGMLDRQVRNKCLSFRRFEISPWLQP